MSRRIDAYRVKRGDNLAVSNFWNQRWEDLDLRIATREEDATLIDASIAEMESVALSRLNDTFTPLIQEAQDALNSFGVSFSSESQTSEVVSEGAHVFTLTEATRGGFYYAQYVAIRAVDSSPSAVMVCEVVSYVRATGVLTVDAQYVTGSGTYNNWTINVGTPPDTIHASRTDNPHSVTAAQVGAYTIAAANAAIAAAIEAAMAELPELTDALLKAENLNDLTNKPAARTNLGLGALATQNEVGTGMFASNVRATQAQAEAGTDNIVLMTPLRVKQAISTLTDVDGGSF